MKRLTVFLLFCCTMAHAADLVFQLSPEKLTQQEQKAPVYFEYDGNGPSGKIRVPLEQTPTGHFELNFPKDEPRMLAFVPPLSLNRFNELGTDHSCMPASEQKVRGTAGRLAVGTARDGYLRLLSDVKAHQADGLDVFSETRHWLFYALENQHLKHQGSCKNDGSTLDIDVKLKKGWNVVSEHKVWFYKGKSFRKIHETITNFTGTSLPMATVFLR